MPTFDERSWRSWGWSGVGLIVMGLAVDSVVHDARSGREEPLTMFFAHAPLYIGVALTVVSGLYGRWSETPEATLILFAGVVQGLAVSADTALALGGWDGGGVAAFVLLVGLLLAVAMLLVASVRYPDDRGADARSQSAL